MMESSDIQYMLYMVAANVNGQRMKFTSERSSAYRAAANDVTSFSSFFPPRL